MVLTWTREHTSHVQSHESSASVSHRQELGPIKEG